jgi:hypothetical protein
MSVELFKASRDLRPVLRLYSFIPSGHGPYSFYVCAESKEQALAAVRAKIIQHGMEGDHYYDDLLSMDHPDQGGGEDWGIYESEPGVVEINAND